MACIEKRPHISYDRSSAPHFRNLTCLLTGIKSGFLKLVCKRNYDRLGYAGSALPTLP